MPNSKKFLKVLSDHYSSTLPIIRTTTVESGTNNNVLSPNIITYDFQSQLKSILDDKTLFSDVNKLSVNKSDIWKPYEKNNQYPFELQDGRIYQNTLMHNKDQNSFHVGIQLYMDKTGVDQYQKYTLEPIMFTLTMFHEEIRCSDKAWRHLGFIPHMHELSSVNNKNLKSGAALRNTHKCIDIILESFYKCQEKPLKCKLHLGNETKEMNITVSIVSIIGDGLSNDILCGKILSRNQHALRLSRCCFTPTNLCDNPYIKCNFIQQWHIESLSLVCLGANSKYHSNSICMNDCNEKWKKYVSWYIANGKKKYKLKSETDNIENTLKRYLTIRQNICHDILKYVYGVHAHDSAFNKAYFGPTTGGIMVYCK